MQQENANDVPLEQSHEEWRQQLEKERYLDEYKKQLLKYEIKILAKQHALNNIESREQGTFWKADPEKSKKY